MSAALIDTNILVYAFSDDIRAERARGLLADGGTLSVQALNEFASVAQRKLGMNWAELEAALAAIRLACPVIIPIDVGIHDRALSLAKRYRLSIFDSLVIAVALHAGCKSLLSEDMQHGMTIDGTLRIENPFLGL